MRDPHQSFCDIAFDLDDQHAAKTRRIKGTRDDDHLVGTAGSDDFGIAQGGSDHVEGLGGDDFIFAGGGFDDGDRIDGGLGQDTLYIEGRRHYQEGIVFQEGALVNVESVRFTAMWNPEFTAVLPAHMAVSGVFFMQIEQIITQTYRCAVTFDASQATDYSVTFFGGLTGDTLIGGELSDRLVGGRAGDVLTGGAGNDNFAMYATSQSTVGDPDLITDFTHGDILEMYGFDGDTTTNGLQPLHFGRTSGRAGDVTVTYSDVSNLTFVNIFTDPDKNPDALIQLAGDHRDLTASDFYFGETLVMPLDGAWSQARAANFDASGAMLV